MNKAEIMQGYGPDHFRTDPTFVALIQAEGPEFEQLHTSLNDILSQFYVETATWGLALWEKELNLTAEAGKSDEDRRSRIISKLRGVGTVNVTLVKKVAESYYYGHVEVVDRTQVYSFDAYRETVVAPYTITIHFADEYGIPPNLDDIKAAIDEIKPAHLAVNYVFNYLTWDVLDARHLTWDQLDAYGLTWAEFETGTWLNK